MIDALLIESIENCYFSNDRNTCEKCPMHPACAEDKKALEKRILARFKELTKWNESITRRMQHLCSSRFIASFDEVIFRTQEYRRDIAEADKLVEEHERLTLQNTELTTALKKYFNAAWTLQSDIVRKMHSEIEARCIKGGIYPAFVKSTIDQVANEMLNAPELSNITEEREDQE